MEYVHRQYLLALAKANVLPRLMEDEVRMKEMGIPAEEFGRLMRKEENHGMKGFDLVKGLLYRVDWREKELEEMVWPSVGRIDRADRTGGRGDRYGQVPANQPRAGLQAARDSAATGQATAPQTSLPGGNVPSKVSAAVGTGSILRENASNGARMNSGNVMASSTPTTNSNRSNIADLLASTYHINLPGNAQPGTEHRILCPQCGGTCRADF